MPKLIWRKLEPADVVERGDVFSDYKPDDLHSLNTEGPGCSTHFVDICVGWTVRGVSIKFAISGVYRLVGVEPLCDIALPVPEGRKIELEL